MESDSLPADAATPEDSAPEVGTTDQNVEPTSEEAPAEDTFFDPTAVPEELKPAYKQMQRAFTKKTQELAKHRHKIEAYDAFEKDPISTIQGIARQMGYNITPAQAAQIQQQQDDEWQPNNWDEVLDKATQNALAKLEEKYQPVVNELRQLKRTHVEQMLDDEVPEWRQYEDEMSGLLREHPSLAKDPAMLARLAIPEKVQEQRAMKAALERLDKKAKSSTVSKGSSTTKPDDFDPNKPMSFDEAVRYATQKLAREAG